MMMKPNAVVDVEITPIGTASATIREYITAAEKVLQQYRELQFEINPMSTTIQGELDTILEAVRKMHDAPFEAGAQRVSTIIRIDERRDGIYESMADRVNSVKRQLNV